MTRADWAVRRFRLGEEPGDDLAETTTAEDRLAMMWPLALEAWSLTGKAVPDYSRAETPVTRRPWRVSGPPALA